MAQLDTDVALATLQALLDRGALLFISADHKCMPDEKGEPKTAEDAERCAAYAAEHSDTKYANPLADPHHFVLVPVTEIMPRPGDETYEARTAKGDRLIGRPQALLRRLTEVTFGS